MWIGLIHQFNPIRIHITTIHWKEDMNTNLTDCNNYFISNFTWVSMLMSEVEENVQKAPSLYGSALSLISSTIHQINITTPSNGQITLMKKIFCNQSTTVTSLHLHDDKDPQVWHFPITDTKLQKKYMNWLCAACNLFSVPHCRWLFWTSVLRSEQQGRWESIHWVWEHEPTLHLGSRICWYPVLTQDQWQRTVDQWSQQLEDAELHKTKIKSIWYHAVVLLTAIIL